MDIQIIEVVSKKDLLKWVRFPNDLYKNDENFVPFLENDELDTLKTEEKEIRQKIKLAEELKEDPKNIIVEERSEKKVENINI